MDVPLPVKIWWFTMTLPNHSIRWVLTSSFLATEVLLTRVREHVKVELNRESSLSQARDCTCVFVFIVDMFCSYQVDYYAHPENYRPIFHEKIAPFASVIGRYLSLELTVSQLYRFLLILYQTHELLQLSLLIKTLLFMYFLCYLWQ